MEQVKLKSYFSYFIKKPEFFFSMATSLFYLYSLWSHSWFWRFAFVIPIALLHYIIFTYAIKWIRKRLQKPQIQLKLELAMASCILLALGILFFVQNELILLSLTIAFFFWLCLQFLLRKTGLFYVSFVSLLLFILMIGTYQCIRWKERRLSSCAKESTLPFAYPKMGTGKVAMRS